MIDAPLMVRSAQHSTQPSTASHEPRQQSFAFPRRLPLKGTVENGNRSFATGQEILAKPLEWVRPADGNFTAAMAQREYSMQEPVVVKFDQYCLLIDLHHGRPEVVMELLAVTCVPE